MILFVFIHPLSIAATFLAMNVNTWNALSDDTKKLMMEQFTTVEDQMWEATKKADQVGMDCNASGPCPMGEPGGMVAVQPTAAWAFGIRGPLSHSRNAAASRRSTFSIPQAVAKV